MSYDMYMALRELSHVYYNPGILFFIALHRCL
jgi:hypothetical protein